MVAVCALPAIFVALGASLWSYHALADKPAVQAKDKNKAAKKGPIRQTVEKFLAAALAGKADEAATLAEPGQITARKIKDDFQDVRVARLPLGIASLQADDQMALAVTENVTIKDPRRGDQKGPLLITVKKIDKGWRVRDVDFGSTEKRIAAFKKEHPKAKARAKGDASIFQIGILDSSPFPLTYHCGDSFCESTCLASVVSGTMGATGAVNSSLAGGGDGLLRRRILATFP